MLIHDAERGIIISDYEEEESEYLDFIEGYGGNISEYRFRKFYVAGCNRVAISAADSLQDLLGMPDSYSEQIGGVEKCQQET